MQSKVVEGLEKALASPQHPLTPQVKAEILEQTLFHSYTGTFLPLLPSPFLSLFQILTVDFC